MGLPEFYEVGVLARVIGYLRSDPESDFQLNVFEAYLTDSHLLALCQGDLRDAAEYLDIEYVTPRRLIQPLL